MYATWFLCRLLNSLEIFLGAGTTELLSYLVEVGYGATIVGHEVVSGTSMTCSM
jgi:hypothetical protein